MSTDQVVKVANEYIQYLKSFGHEPANLANDLDGFLQATKHALWMCYQLRDLPQEDMEKACRWLGFVQGVLWARGLYSINDMREHNRE